MGREPVIDSLAGDPNQHLLQSAKGNYHGKS